MNIVNLSGGLGNQMFQYAFARQLAHAEERSVFLNTSGIRGLRHYGLDLFNTSVPVLTDDDTSHVATQRSMAHQVNESLAGYDPCVLEPQDAPIVMFNGFWQCENYFQDAYQMLRKEFTLKESPPPGGPNLTALQRPNSVCLHVRLGDYLRFEGSFLGFVGCNYYRQAIDEMIKRVPDAHFFVFSDDLGWCMETLQIDHPHSFINYDPGPAKAALALSVMSHCTHFVIGNSTFAWWAAWLGNAANKIVIAPKGWFATERSAAEAARRGPLSSKDLVPPAWLRV